MQTHPRLRKETLVLFWPWCAVMLALGVVMLWNYLFTIRYWDVTLHTGAPVLGLGVTFLAALSFGSEFQSRTLPMLLSQPCSRLRLWSEKMLVLTYFLFLPLLAYSRRGLNIGTDDWSLLSEFCLIFALACSTGFWTLFARSTLGGMVFSIAALGALMLSVTCLVGQVWSSWPELVDGMTPFFMAMAGLVYGLLFLWLGWWKFSRLEVNTADGGESGLNATAGNDVPVTSALRSRVGSPLGNLVRKELRLQRPLLVFALLFSLFWLALTGLAILVPSQKAGAELLLEVLTAFYVILSLVLAGCLPLCEERALGIHQSNLTLPVAVRTQWWLKLGVALLIGGLAAIALPLILSNATAHSIESPLADFAKSWTHSFATEFNGTFGKPKTGTDTPNEGLWWLGIAAFGLLVVLGHWSATLIQRTTHAILWTAFAFLGLVVATMLGRLALRSFGAGHSNGFRELSLANHNVTVGGPGIVTEHGLHDNFAGPTLDVINWVTVHFHLPVYSGEYFAANHSIAEFIMWPAILVTLLVTGFQARRAFGVPHPQTGRRFRALGWMVGIVTLTAAVGVAARRGASESSVLMAHAPIVE